MTIAEKILDLLRRDRLTVSELTDQIGCSRSTVQHNIRKLSSAGKVRMAWAKDEGGKGQGSSVMWEAK